MQGRILGVFGGDPVLKGDFLKAIAKKSEAEGIALYHRTEGGVDYSFLDDAQFPAKIQGYSRIASISDYAYLILPKFGRFGAPDGELVILLDSFGLPGSLIALDEDPQPNISGILRDTVLERFPVEKRESESSVIALSGISPGPVAPRSGGTLVYIDRAFSVKGVGVVVLGFILAGKVSVHDELRLIPCSERNKTAEVKGIQVSDVDYPSVERGVRVGISLKGVELKDLEKVSWMDDGTYETGTALSLRFTKSSFYKQTVHGRDMHLQLPGELVTCRVAGEEKDPEMTTMALPFEVPSWPGMRVSLIDLNGKNLRVAGGGLVNF